MGYFSLGRIEWDDVLQKLILSHNVFATVSNGSGNDYELIRPSDIGNITYNIPIPATSLKTFFLPVIENVTNDRAIEKPSIIIGTPNCDVEGLNLLDEIYLDEEYRDPAYSKRRENTLIISSDCFSTGEHCHCTTYNIDPFSNRTADLALALLGDQLFFRVLSVKGEKFLATRTNAIEVIASDKVDEIEKKHQTVKSILAEKNGYLPGLPATSKLIESAGRDIWQKYSAKCVSCGACNAICPTCSCFLLIDRSGFEKIRHMDACQYPGFERVAGGEDPLLEIQNRFSNRYMCKYLWRSKRFGAVACTGCGRCIEACLGRINKNELIQELNRS